MLLHLKLAFIETSLQKLFSRTVKRKLSHFESKKLKIKTLRTQLIWKRATVFASLFLLKPFIIKILFVVFARIKLY